MSANNQIWINRLKDKFIVEDVDIETGRPHQLITDKAKTLEEAVTIANNYKRENEVEYGLDIIL